MQLQTNSVKTPQEQEEEPTSCFDPQLTTLDAVAQQNYTTYCKDQYGTPSTTKQPPSTTNMTPLNRPQRKRVWIPRQLLHDSSQEKQKIRKQSRPTVFPLRRPHPL